MRLHRVDPRETPATVATLCQQYRAVTDEERIPPLLMVATFVFDLLCLHPFRDGNGRVSRLVTSLLLQSRSYQVIRYISLERIIEESKEEYYSVLKLCSQGWHEGTNEIVPWWNYFLSMLRRVYKEFENQVEFVEARLAKTDLVRRAVLSQVDLAVQHQQGPRSVHSWRALSRNRSSSMLRSIPRNCSLVVLPGLVALMS